jgi:pectate lyase
VQYEITAGGNLSHKFASAPGRLRHLDFLTGAVAKSIKATTIVLHLAAVMILEGTLMAQPAAYEGYGYATRGGDGGDTYHVTTLEDGGEGSLRYGITNIFGPRITPRTIVFDVGGTIVLTNDLLIRDPLLTIDGSTAPSPGITITKTNDALYLAVAGSHDIILRYLRIKGTYLITSDGNESSNAFIGLDGDWGGIGEVTNVVMDHLTIENGTDGACDIWGKVSSVTMSWCLIMDNFHPSTLSFVSETGDPDQARRRISIHHNVWARNAERNPQIRGDVADLDYVNNIIYDWGHWEAPFGYGIRIRNVPGEAKVSGNIVNNYFLPVTVSSNSALIYGILPGADADDGGPASAPSQGTVMTNSLMGNLWVSGNRLPAENMDQYSTIPKPNPVPTNAHVTTHHVLELRDRVVPNVGMKYRTEEEQALLYEIAAAMEGPPEIGILSVTRATCVLELKTPTGFRSQLQVSASIQPAAWAPLTNFVGNGAWVSITNTLTGASTRFYRAITTDSE